MIASIIALSVILGATTATVVEFFKKAAAAGKAFFVKIIGGWKTIVTAVVVGLIVGAGYKALLVTGLAALFLSAAQVTALAAFAGMPWLGFIAAGGYSGAVVSGVISLISGWLKPSVK